MAEPYYTNAEGFRTYILPETTELSDVAITAMIIKAERDVDEFLGGGAPEANGRLLGDPLGVDGSVVNPGDLDDWQITKLAEATNAQTAYRLHWGEEYFILPQTPVDGEEYSTDQKLPKFAPNAKKHLRAAGMIAMTSRIV
jgi:hypothetical protein